MTTTPQAALLISDLELRAIYDKHQLATAEIVISDLRRILIDAQAAIIAKLQATQAEPVQAGELPDERAAFEAYMSDNGKWPAAVQRYDNGARGYVLLQTSAAWGTWQARAALSARKPLTD